MGGVAAGVGMGGSVGGEVEGGRRDGEFYNLGAENFGDEGGYGEGNFVEAGGFGRILGREPVDEEGMVYAKQGEGLGEEGDEGGIVDADELATGSGGIGEGADEIEKSADAEGATDGRDAGEGGMEGGREEESEVVFAERGGGGVGRGLEGNAEGFKDVG